MESIYKPGQLVVLADDPDHLADIQGRIILGKPNHSGNYEEYQWYMCRTPGKNCRYYDSGQWYIKESWIDPFLTAVINIKEIDDVLETQEPRGD